MLAAPRAEAEPIRVGAARTELYAPMLEGRRIALLSNHTGTVDSLHTVDVMLRHGLRVTTLLSPEHGFRGTADAGEKVAGGVDSATGLPVVSLYGTRKNPLDKQFFDSIDVMVVDLQDVGTRFYTYYVTMIKVMEHAARHATPVVVMDRPNPLGRKIDGPILDMSLRSGVGRLPIPVMHGMTMGELALMANGRGWLADSLEADLTVIPCDGYTGNDEYILPVAPSPNLRTMEAIYLYPSTCYFEGTTASLGRGTDAPFTIYGHPLMKSRDGFSFTPRSIPGAKSPPQLGRLCHGRDLRGIPADELRRKGVDLQYVVDAYRSMPPGEARKKFFTPFFNLLIGRSDIRPMIESGASAEEIKATWAADTLRFAREREPYLLYK